MSNPVRIVIAVVVLGLAAAGIAVKTMNRPEPAEAVAAVESTQGDSAAPETAEVSQDEVTPPPEATEELAGTDEASTREADTETFDPQPTGPQAESDGGAEPEPTTEPERENQPAGQGDGDNQDKKLPVLVDLGKGTCIPCKKMLPILQGLQEEYEGRAVIEIIDLRDDPDAGRRYGIRLIPTQVFFDSDGKEVWRHEGFMSRDAIIEKLKEMGVD